MKNKPEFPLNSFIYETDPGPYCPKCGSSLKTFLNFLFFRFRKKTCINPKCKNYE